MTGFADSAITPIPAQSGIGLRSVHYRELLDTLPRIGWLEAHSENYFGAGGQPLFYLEALRHHYPLSLHGVGLGIGSPQPLSQLHLDKLKSLCERFEPGLVSEHLCWNAYAGQYHNDLLPLPYTEEALTHVCERIAQVQDTLRRQILIENVSSYLEFSASTMPEWEFLQEVSQRAGCGILLDINNIYVSACNHDFAARDYLHAISPHCVQEIHLAGFEQRNDVLVDTHSRPICDAVWTLYRDALARFGPRPTLIEWDNDIPELTILLGEAQTAQKLLQQDHEQLAPAN